MFVPPQLRRFWVLLVVALCVVPSLALAAPLETDLGDRLQAALSGQGGSMQLAYLLAFLGGVATSLTPCVYPLIPITIGLFGAREAPRAQALGLAACYVGGIAATYTTLGLVVGLVGGQFGTFMTSPWVIVPVAVFFLLMAASMFGAFELSLPNELQGKLSQVGGQGPIGAFLMGLVAGIVAAPCTGPPLAALLLFVSTQRSVLLGGSLLFVYAIGMGMLFFAIAGFALKLPKSGAWMDGVKAVFGVVMIVAALYYLRNVVPLLRMYGKSTTVFLVSQAGLVVLGILVGGLTLSFADGPRAAMRKALGVLLMCVGLYGSVAWALAPRGGLHWLTNEAAAVQKAQSEGKPLLVDFGAEWCVPCKQMETKTFSNEEVRRELSRFVLLRIDCSESTPENEKLQQKYQSQTLPSVLVYDRTGQRTAWLREFTPPETLLPILLKTP
ncbi:MAG TPA: cytochrome c biogenesis protein CcdA [Pseudomonadota bacterium]|jgi:thiol:disulfide interchange protein DsbD|nr:cytochrome c biogenesis protein CcdA [Pseudomonadota bacterium]HNN52869.1 cytochrome c biogenesis protein CcdA [Pseudomonadota bacterium]HNO67492.1 cytochrome c biogenesis protein CcdA [Pseudomonadota bacterium]